MDLLGDIGMTDQLTSVREENKVLQEKCKALSARVHVLTIENETLKAEIEMYRDNNNNNSISVVQNNFNSLSIVDPDTTTSTDPVLVTTTTTTTNNNDLFIKSGNGQYVTNDEQHISINNLHDNSNILSCTMSDDGIYIATGAANGTVHITQWNSIYDHHTSVTTSIPTILPTTIPTATPAATTTSSTSLVATDTVRSLYSNSTPCSSSSAAAAPAIAVRFAPTVCGLHIRSPNSLLAVGCMDGSLHLVSSSSSSATTTKDTTTTDSQKSNVNCQTVHSIKDHQKYIRDVAWSPNHPILSSASADGTVQLYTVSRIDDTDYSDENENEEFNNNNNIVQKYTTKSLQSLHLNNTNNHNSVECITYTGDGTKLVCYSRGTPYLSIVDIEHDYAVTKINVNTLDPSACTGGFSDHVSYSIMSMCFSPLVEYSNTILACATDISKNIIIDLRCSSSSTSKSGRSSIVRTLYGHTNDMYSQPKIAWNTNGQYLYGNTQNESSILIWDIASTKIISKLYGHTNIIRDIYTTPTVSNTVLTTSFDKQTKLWFSKEI